MYAVAPPFDLESFGGDEVFLLLASGILCGYGLFYWAARLLPVSKLGFSRWHRLPLYLAVVAGFGILGVVVAWWADPQIRENSGYILLVLLMGGTCLTIAGVVLPWMGISLRDDAFERPNVAATLTLSGMLMGVLITYAGANIGTGPSFWNNVFSSLLATGALLMFWLLVAAVGMAAENIVQERDVASGLRVGLFLVAESLVLSRAIAGDWVSTFATVSDLVRDGWPAAALCLIAIVTEQIAKPSRENPRPGVLSRGLGPGIGYLLVSAGWCIHLGAWEGMSR